MKTGWEKALLVLLLTAIAVTVWIAVSQRFDSAVQTIYQDTDNNGFQEKYCLADNQLQVYENDRLIWQSSKEWNIKQICLADADNDQQTELLMLLWKHGSFGPSKPFWLKGPDNEYSCHLFMYRLVSGRLKEVWCSSALVHPIIEMKVEDVDRDGLNKLIVIEGPPAGFAYQLRQLFHRREITLIWDNWGFKIQQEGRSFLLDFFCLSH